MKETGIELMSRNRQHGFALMELMVALGIVAVAMAIGIVAFHTGRVAQVQQTRRACATSALEIGLERIKALDVSALPQPGKSASFPIHPQIASQLPKAWSRLRCSSVDGHPRLLLLQLKVQWGGAEESMTAETLVAKPDPGKGGKP